MPLIFPVIRFLYERGPRLASSPEEAAALKYIENQLQVQGADTSAVSFPSMTGSDWYYAFCYSLFPLATILFLEEIWIALLVAFVGIMLLRLDLFIWPIVVRLFSGWSRSRTVYGRLSCSEELRQTVVVTANVDSRHVFPLLPLWPSLERVLPTLSVAFDYCRAIQFILMLVALICNFFAMRAQVNMLWRCTWPIAIVYLFACAMMLVQAMYGTTLQCANDNLSGLQVLENLAAAFAEKPAEHTDVVLAATGSGRAGMLGVYYFIQALRPKRDATFFLNISAVGSGRVMMVGSEGYSRPLSASEELTDWGYLAGSETPIPLEVTPIKQQRTDAAMARSLGYRAMTLTGVTPYQRPPLLVEEKAIEGVNILYTTDCIQRIIATIDRGT